MMALGRYLCAFLPLAVALGRAQPPKNELRLIEIDPGHSHISGLHSKSLPGVSNEVHIYSPLTPELASHLAALARFNARETEPTHWAVRLFAGPDYLNGLAGEGPGNIVALSGRNEKKIGYIQAALAAGQNVFADKPWIISSSDFPKLEAALQLADTKHLVTYDWMTLRGNKVYQLQRDLLMDTSVFGRPQTGSVDNPAVRLENLHALLKFANGLPQQRPPSFLDIRQQGEGLADVGTHLADLVQWSLFPNQAISYRSDLRVLKADRSPLILTLDQFTRLTGQTTWPDYLKSAIVDGQLKYFANGSCIYSIRGVYVRLKVGWQFEAPHGAQDSYFASYLGTRSSIELRAGVNENYIPQIYVTPGEGIDSRSLEANLKRALLRLNDKYAGLSLEKTGRAFHVLIPPADRGGDDLRNIFDQFAGYVRDPRTFPAFENINLLAKYYLTTTAVAMAQSQQ